MKAPSTYECHTIDCDEIVQKGDEVLGCDQSGGCPELRDAMEF